MRKILETLRGSEMVVEAARFNLKIEVKGLINKRERRAVLLATFRRIDPLFKLLDFEDHRFDEGWIVHRDGSWENAFRDLERGVKLRQAVRTRTSEQKLGFEIRMRRLKIGLSQQALAASAGINRSHLSQIERGQCRVKLMTLRLIENALGRPTTGQQLTKAA
jgi:DNA-binding XRE family transcriptional regulator